MARGPPRQRHETDVEGSRPATWTGAFSHLRREQGRAGAGHGGEAVPKPPQGCFSTSGATYLKTSEPVLRVLAKPSSARLA